MSITYGVIIMDCVMIQQMKIQMDKIWVRGGIGNHGRFKWKYLNMYGYS